MRSDTPEEKGDSESKLRRFVYFPRDTPARIGQTMKSISMKTTLHCSKFDRLHRFLFTQSFLSACEDKKGEHLALTYIFIRMMSQ